MHVHIVVQVGKRQQHLPKSIEVDKIQYDGGIAKCFVSVSSEFFNWRSCRDALNTLERFIV